VVKQRISLSSRHDDRLARSLIYQQILGWGMLADASQQPWVFVVDDDCRFLNALKGLLAVNGYRVAAFTSPVQFLDQHDPKLHGCLLLDLQMSELNGLEVQSMLAALGESRPVVFLSGTNGAEAAVSAMKGGALDYLVKPVEADVVLGAVQSAIEEDKFRQKERVEMAALMNRWRQLSPRQQEVFWHVVVGRLNKQIAHDMQVTEKTIKVHRATMMEKLKARSTAELVHIAERIHPLHH
jgi:FixJ family two-component response regulator